MEFSNAGMIGLIIIIIIVISAVFLSIFIESKSHLNEPKMEYFHPKDFLIHNYYKVPVDIRILQQDTSHEINIAEQIPSLDKIKIDLPSVKKYLRRGSIVRVYTSGSKAVLIGESILQIPNNTTIKALHVGMNTSHEDLSMASEITKSSLGSALARVRIVNTTPKCITLTTGTASLKIGPNSDMLYTGENMQGIHYGVVLHDEDGILQDFVINKPMTDIHLGIVSDAQIALYTGSKIGGDLDDTTEFVNYPFELHGLGGPSRSANIDRTYIS